MNKSPVVLPPIADGPIIVLAARGETLISNDAGELMRCNNLRDALERAGWVYVGTTVRH